MKKSNKAVTALHGSVKDGLQPSTKGNNTMTTSNTNATGDSSQQTNKKTENRRYLLITEIRISALAEINVLASIQGSEPSDPILIATFKTNFQTRQYYEIPPVFSFDYMDLTDFKTVDSLMILLNFLTKLGFPRIDVNTDVVCDEKLIRHIFSGMTYKHNNSTVSITLDEKTRKVLSDRTSKVILKAG